MLKTMWRMLINIVTYIRRVFRRSVYIIDVPNPYNRTSPKNIRDLAHDIHRLFGAKEFIGVAWRGGDSDHEKGLALDIIPNCFPFTPRLRQRKTMESVYRYLLSHADKYKISYVIWQNNITEYPQWKTKKNIVHTNGRTRSELHQDHVHVSFMKAGK